MKCKPCQLTRTKFPQNKKKKTIDGWINGQTGRQTDRQTDRQTGNYLIRLNVIVYSIQVSFETLKFTESFVALEKEYNFYVSVKK